MTDKFDKLVLALKRDKLFEENDHFQGFSPAEKKDFISNILNNYEWLRRGDIENDTNIKHPISYCIIVNPNTKKIFSYIRSDKDEHYTEQRLHGKLSIGIGGHIEKEDLESNNNPIESAMLRELEEEVTIKGNINPKILGYINDDNQYDEDTINEKISVGRVHFGLLYIIETDAEQVVPNDPEIAQGKFRTLAELEELKSKPEITIETWSEISLKPLKNYFDNIPNNKVNNKVNNNIIIGITGTLAAGKGTLSEYLVKKGFKHYSVREFLNNELTNRGLPINRENLVNIANKLREHNSNSFIIEKLYEIAKESGGNAIIESIRNPGEVQYLKTEKNFYLISIDADPKSRFERLRVRNNETDKISFEEFLRDEQKELESNHPHKQNIKACIEMANFKIENNETVETFYKKIDETLNKIKNKRPSWDEYFIEITKAVSNRATCDRGKTGSVVVKDKHILVTGYVGSPAGLPHCDEVGHQMKSFIHEDGSESKHCMRTTHSEQNAICQAAKLGIQIEGATLYTKMTPCSTCAKIIINSGLKRVVCEKRYHAGYECEELFKQAGISFNILNDVLVEYKDQ